MPIDVLWLRSAGSLDPERVGGKAARLAAAMQCGLPVLPGLVIPVCVGARLLESAAHEASVHGVHVARLSVMDAVEPDLTDLEDHARVLGDELVVRSSSTLETSAAYVGAFTSYLGIAAPEIATAVRGVWASALTDERIQFPDAAVAMETHKPHMAVLVQRQIHPAFAGTARVGDGHVVTVVAVKGSPVPLLTGWSRGETAAVAEAGRVSGKAAIALVGEQLIREVSELACSVEQDLGDNLIEWAISDEKLFLLQATRVVRPPYASATSTETREHAPPAAAGVARLLHRYAGPLGEELILPILLAGVCADSGQNLPSRIDTVTRSEAGAAWADAQALSRTLRVATWADPGSSEVFSPISQLREGTVAEAIGLLIHRPAVDSGECDHLLALLDTVAWWLEHNGTLLRAEDLWAVDPSQVADLIAGDIAAQHPTDRREGRRRALLRWEPWVYTAVSGTGSVVYGDPVSPGIGAGLAVRVLGLPGGSTAVPRMVLIAPNPIPQLAPLLWGASGLVTTGGSGAAHLVEVARSLGVAAVVGCSPEQLFSLVGPSTRTLVAVDGDSGRVVVDAEHSGPTSFDIHSGLALHP